MNRSLSMASQHSHSNTLSPNAWFEQWQQQSKFSLAPMMEFQAITTRLLGELARQNLKTLNALAQCATEQMQDLSHAKGVDDVVHSQARSASRAAPEVYEHAQKV